jgi:hypothetical protein
MTLAALANPLKIKLKIERRPDSIQQRESI